MNNERVSFKEINRLAIPAIFAGIAEPIIGLVDTGVIGHLGEDSEIAQAAVGLGATFYSLLLWSLSQIRTSISSLVSRYIGANNLKDIASLIPQTIFFGFLLGIIIGGTSFFFSEDIFKFFYGVGEDQQALLANTLIYFKIRIIGLPISLIVYTIFGIFRGSQNTMWIMKASITGAVVNMILDYILVFGIGDFKPNMGIEGVAIASVAAQVMMMLVAIYLLKTKTVFNIIPSFKLNKEFVTMLKMSSNMLVRTIALNTAFFLGNRYATSYGEDYLAAHTILMNIWVFSFFFIDGFSNAGNAISGKLAGSKEYRKLKFLAQDLIKMNLIIGLILASIFLLLSPILGSVFSNNEVVVEYFNSVFWILIIAQFINAITFTYDGIFKGLGETAYLRNTLIVATFFVFWPILFGLDFIGYKLTAIWIAFIFWNFFRGASLIYKFKKVYVPQV
jgi:MATE family multidrug resistance protein